MNVIAASHTADKIYRFSGFSSTVDSSFAYTNPGGVVWNPNDSNLYFAEFGGTTKKASGFSSTILDSYATPGGSLVYGMDFIGSNVVFVTDASVTKIYQQSGFSATVDSSLTIALASFYGVAHDGTNLLSQSNPAGSAKFRKHDGFSTTILDSFITVAVAGLDISWDETNLISTTNATNPIKQRLHSGFSATISDSFQMAAGNTSSLGVDWDGFPSAASATDHGLILRLSMTF